MSATIAKPRKHIFAHLGQAPYRLVSIEMREQDPNGPRCGTSCDYCCTYITNVFHCEGADSKRFVIGSTCVEKLGDAGLKKVVDEKVRKHRQELRQAKLEAAWEAARPAREAYEREQAAARAEQITHIKAEFERVLPLLKSTPHPNAYFASKGKTMLDYAEYCCGNLSDRDDDFWYRISKIKQIIREAA